MNTDVFSNKEDQRSHRCHKTWKKGRRLDMTRLLLTQLKHWTRKIAIFWRLAFNEWWTSESIPADHLKALVASIFKKRNTQDIANYRPTSLLTCTYKIFTSILQTRIASIIDPHLARNQYGFRSSHSTQQPVFIARRIQDIAEVSGGELLLLLTFLGWKQAFDKEITIVCSKFWNEWTFQLKCSGLPKLCIETLPFKFSMLSSLCKSTFSNVV